MTEENALIRLETLCAGSERCVHELREKLRGWGIDSSAAQRVIDNLIENRYVDDSRFARAFVNDKLKFSGYGRIKIRFLLASKRIERDIINDSLSTIDEDEYFSVLMRIMGIKARKVDATTFEGRRKLYLYGLSRGFESEFVLKAVKEYCKTHLDR